MPAFLEGTFAGLAARQEMLRGPDGLFSPVEQVWHLADLFCKRSTGDNNEPR